MEQNKVEYTGGIKGIKEQSKKHFDQFEKIMGAISKLKGGENEKSLDQNTKEKIQKKLKEALGVLNKAEKELTELFNVANREEEEFILTKLNEIESPKELLYSQQMQDTSTTVLNRENNPTAEKEKEDLGQYIDKVKGDDSLNLEQKKQAVLDFMLAQDDKRKARNRKEQGGVRGYVNGLLAKTEKFLIEDDVRKEDGSIDRKKTRVKRVTKAILSTTLVMASTVALGYHREVGASGLRLAGTGISAGIATSESAQKLLKEYIDKYKKLTKLGKATVILAGSGVALAGLSLTGLLPAIAGAVTIKSVGVLGAGTVARKILYKAKELINKNTTKKFESFDIDELATKYDDVEKIVQKVRQARRISGWINYLGGVGVSTGTASFLLNEIPTEKVVDGGTLPEAKVTPEPSSGSIEDQTKISPEDLTKLKAEVEELEKELEELQNTLEAQAENSLQNFAPSNAAIDSSINTNGATQAEILAISKFKEVSGDLDKLTKDEIANLKNYLDKHDDYNLDGNSDGNLSQLKQEISEKQAKLAETKKMLGEHLADGGGEESIVEKPKASGHRQIPDEAVVKKGEGITYAFKAQIDKDPELGRALAKQMGYKGKVGTASFYKALGQHFGYIDQQGHEIRVKWGGEKGALAAYPFEKNGEEYIVTEYHKDSQGNWLRDESHGESEKFEGKDYEKDYEYYEDKETKSRPKLEDKWPKPERVIQIDPEPTSDPDDNLPPPQKIEEKSPVKDPTNTPTQATETEPDIYGKERVLSSRVVLASDGYTYDMVDSEVTGGLAIAETAKHFGYKLTNGQINYVGKTNAYNLKSIFGDEKKEWVGKFSKMPASKLLKMNLGDKVSGNQEELSMYIKMLYKATGERPFNDGIGMNKETSKDYIARMLIHLEANGKLQAFNKKFDAYFVSAPAQTSDMETAPEASAKTEILTLKKDTALRDFLSNKNKYGDNQVAKSLLADYEKYKSDIQFNDTDTLEEVRNKIEKYKAQVQNRK